MDLKQALGKFFTPEGEIVLAPQLTLAGLAETLYQSEAAQGIHKRQALRFWDFASSAEGVAVDFTREQINTRIKSVAVRLAQVGKPGERVAILAGNSPEYLFAFMGALYAGMTPVPLYDPAEPGHADHLAAVLDDAQPRFVTTSQAYASSVRSWFAGKPAAQRPRIIAVDALPDTLASSWTPGQVPEGAVDSVAFLQYTSGSTRTPAGVVLTNRSIITNVLQIFVAIQLKTPLRLVTWLPLHHDMGIILAAFGTILGLEIEMMTPRDFVQRPSRWLRQISRRESEDVTTYTVVPNFALDLAARFPGEGSYDFSLVDGIIVGSEPVTRKALDDFSEAFGAQGLRREALRPSYGLAEASLLVTTPQTPHRPVITRFDREELAAGKATAVSSENDDAVTIVSNGQVVQPQALIIVDPETRHELPEGQVGEIWTHGANTALGYLEREADTRETFGNTLAGRLEWDSRAGNAPDEGWLATGDLAAIVDGEIYITGRRKDLIVIAGRNHYPQDIEHTVAEATQHVSPTAVAAFSVAGEDVEQLVILAERADGAERSDDDAARAVIRAAVSSSHGVVPADIRILAPQQIARSSSAKMARRVARKNYLES